MSAARGFLDLCFALRPLLWIPAIALFAAGETTHPLPPLPPVPESTSATLGSLLLLLGAVHAANGWRDRAGDRVNRKGRAVASGAISGHALAIAGGFSAAGALVLAMHSSVAPASRALLATGAMLGAGYVVPGLEWKRRAGWDLLSHGLGYGVVAFLLGASAAGGIAPGAAAWGRAALSAMPFAAGICAVALVTMIADSDGDRVTGQRTLAFRLGDRRAWRLARAFAWSSLLGGLYVGAWVPALWGLLAGTALSLQEFEGRDGANRCAILLQLAFMALLLPRAPGAVLLVVGIAVLASAYGAWRWGEGYPWNRIWCGSGKEAMTRGAR
ncbi:MAG TPA: UbiA family prenyltransferase [Candidatus Eisenbacteria bacterium]|nr:UbiA family prenyltransferase [Candidatus Eisenbacteria bacterium]